MTNTLETDEPRGRHRRYRATDPSGNYVRCNCGRPDCWTQGLLPIRAHMAALFRALVALGYSECFAEYERADDPWPGVIYALQMAAGLEDLHADPSFVYDDEAAFWCGDAWDREEEDREAASKYAAALVIFNFAWQAYEAAIELSAVSLHPKDKLPVRARRILQAEATAADSIPGLSVSYRVARAICGRDADIKAELEASEGRYALPVPAAAAELARIFRNHVIHGRDALPAYDTEPCWRFYAVTRLLLLLTQYLVLRRVTDRDKLVPLSVNQSELGDEPAGIYLANLHYEDTRWRTASPLPVGYNGKPVTRRFAGA